MLYAARLRLAALRGSASPRRAAARLLVLSWLCVVNLDDIVMFKYPGVQTFFYGKTY